LKKNIKTLVLIIAICTAIDVYFAVYSEKLDTMEIGFVIFLVSVLVILTRSLITKLMGKGAGYHDRDRS